MKNLFYAFILPFRYLWKDTVDVLMWMVIFVLAVADLFWGIVPSGGYALIFVYVTFLIIRKNHWKTEYEEEVEDEDED